MELQPAPLPRDRSFGQRWRAQASSLARLFPPLALLAAGPAHALDPSTPLLHYGHTAWRVQDGDLIAAPNALAQTNDGYLWIGTSSGLVRFDGVDFDEFATKDPLAAQTSDSLLAARDGDLWMGADNGLIRLHGGQFSRYGGHARIDQLFEDARGTIWFTRSRTMDGLGPLGQVSGEQVRYVGKAQGLDLVFGKTFAMAPDGSAWVGSSEGVLEWNGHSAVLHRLDSNSSASGSAGPEALATAPDGSLWAGFATDSSKAGLQHLVDGRWTQIALPGLGGSAAHVSRLKFDRHHVLWIGTVDHGLFRWRDGQIDHFGVEDGLSGDGVSALVEDAEGDMWVGTTGGLDRFGDLRVVSFSSRDGLAANTVESLSAAPDGSLWIGDLTAVEQIRDGHVVRSLRVGASAGGGQFNTVFVDRSNRVWVGVDDDLAVLEGNHFKRIRMPDGKPIGLVIDIAQDADGAIWALPIPHLKRMVRVVQERVVAELTPSDPYRRVTATADGAIWMSTNGTHSLTRYKGKRFDVFPYPSTQPAPAVLGLRPGPDGSVVGSSKSTFVAWRDGQSRSMTKADGLPCDRIFGVAVDHQQTLWLYASCGVMRIPVESFRSWWDRPGSKIAVRTYDVRDGAQPDDASFGTSGAVTADGRVWFVNGTQLQMIDPGKLQDNVVVPPVHIDAVVADHVHYAVDRQVRLGTNPAAVEIDYTATSFVAPRKVVFRYMLEGHDAAWQTAGARRQAFYTDLKPGHYRFHVVASNSDGLWNTEGASVDVDVPPTFTQTRWFVALCVAGAALVLRAVFQLRLRQIRLRLDARVNERERIARELHDTLLQSAHGLIMVLQARLSRSSLSETDRHTLDKAVQRASELVAEGRDRIDDLRAEPASARELFASLKAFGEALDPEGSRFHAVLEGLDRPIENEVKEEVRRIVGEALSNAFRHSQARTVTLRMAVGERALILSVDDDGIGMAQEVLAPGGASGHWGMTGMRERADRIGAHLRITSVADKGTAVQVRVAASRAFRERSWRSAWAALRPLRRRNLPDQAPPKA